MAYSFEEIMTYHPDNIIIYEEIKRNISVLCPFIGAGLTQFAYYSWADALRQLIQKITEKGRAEQILSNLQEGTISRQHFRIIYSNFPHQ